MSTNGIEYFKVKFVREDAYGFKKGQVYKGLSCKSKLGKTEMIGVIDDWGEEYAYPASWFEVIEGEKAQE